MSPSTATRTWGVVPVRSGSKRMIAAVALVAIAVAVAWMAQQMPEPAKAPAITIQNPNDYAVTIEDTGQGPRGWVTVGIVGPKGTTVAHEVIDQGSSWSLRFTSQGRDFDGYEISRSQLADDGWHYTVPDDIGSQLDEAGVPHSP